MNMVVLLGIRGFCLCFCIGLLLSCCIDHDGSSFGEGLVPNPETALSLSSVCYCQDSGLKGVVISYAKAYANYFIGPRDWDLWVGGRVLWVC